MQNSIQSAKPETPEKVWGRIVEMIHDAIDQPAYHPDSGDRVTVRDHIKHYPVTDRVGFVSFRNYLEMDLKFKGTFVLVFGASRPINISAERAEEEVRNRLKLITPTVSAKKKKERRKMKSFKTLSEEEQNLVVSHFRSAMFHRTKQWDHEREIERILGTEIDVDFGMASADVGVGITGPDDISFVNADYVANFID